MSKTADKSIQEEEIVEHEEYDLNQEIDEGDYGFVLGPDGTLKSMFAPDDFYLDPPAKIKKILKILGIKDINTAWDDDITIH